MKRLSLVFAASLLWLPGCDDSSPSSPPPGTFLTVSDIVGSWVTVRAHEKGFMDLNGDRRTWDTTYATPLGHPSTEMWAFAPLLATWYTKDDGWCFSKVDSIPFSLSGNRMIGGFWSGSEYADSELFKWSISLSEVDSSLILTYVEDESYREVGWYDTSHEVWDYYLEPPPDGVSLDSLARTIAGCTLPKSLAPARNLRPRRTRPIE